MKKSTFRGLRPLSATQLAESRPVIVTHPVRAIRRELEMRKVAEIAIQKVCGAVRNKPLPHIMTVLAQVRSMEL